MPLQLGGDSRGAAGSGGDALISGFVIAGADAAQRVLLRGVGPGLAKFGETGAALDPLPPVGSKQKDVRYFHIHEDDPFDEAQLADWIGQASQLPGERM